MKKYILTALSVLFACSIFGQTSELKGITRGDSGECLPFATIFCKELAKGTTSNVEGNYQLDLPPGNYTIQYKYLGYETKNIGVRIAKGTTEQNIQMHEQKYAINEVKVSATAEDPAYYIMRKAIGMSQYYLNQVSEYTCEVYMKGVSRLVDGGFIMKMMDDADLEELKATKLTEIYSKVNFKQPNNYVRKLISIKSTMEKRPIDPMNYVNKNFYYDSPMLVSPLSPRAFKVYKFELEGSFKDHDRFVNKIKVTPRRKGVDVYQGYIYLCDDYWNIHSVDLTSHFMMLDIRFKQLFAPIENEIWMPISNQIELKGNIMGVKFKDEYSASSNKYEIMENTNIDQSILHVLNENAALKRENEIDRGNSSQEKPDNSSVKQTREDKRLEKMNALLQKDELSNSDSRKLQKLMMNEFAGTQVKKDLNRSRDEHVLPDSLFVADSLFWKRYRTVPLTKLEQQGYAYSDSIKKVHSSPQYLDSIEKLRTEYKFGHFLFGKTLVSKDKKTTHKIPGLTALWDFGFNTVDGFVYTKAYSYRHDNDRGQSFFIEPSLSYGFSRKALMGRTRLRFLFDGIKRSQVDVDFGRQSRDFNKEYPMSRLLNSAYSLFVNENHLKLYQSDYLSLGYHTDIANGLRISTKLEYDSRKELTNHSDFSFYNPDKRDFTANVPVNMNLTQGNLTARKAFVGKIELQYTPRYFYEIDKGRKQMLNSAYPSFKLAYEQGFNNVLSSTGKFHKMEFAMEQNISFGLFNNIFYQLKAGQVNITKETHFADFKHFSTNPLLFKLNAIQSDLMRSSDARFNLLDYYKSATDGYYLEGHLNYAKQLLILKYLPLLNTTSIRECLSLHYLKTNELNHYLELGYGLKNIFMVFDLDFFASFENGKHEQYGLKISVPFGKSGNINL